MVPFSEKCSVRHVMIMSVDDWLSCVVKQSRDRVLGCHGVSRDHGYPVGCTWNTHYFHVVHWTLQLFRRGKLSVSVNKTVRCDTL